MIISMVHTLETFYQAMVKTSLSSICADTKLSTTNEKPYVCLVWLTCVNHTSLKYLPPLDIIGTPQSV